MEYIRIFFGGILGFLYNIIGNYGVSIIIFTFLIKFALSPLDLKQRKSALRMQQVQPVLNQLQKKYGNDKEKLNSEMMKVYRQYNISPTSGCLPMLLQFPIIIALYWVIRQPITYVMGLRDVSEQALLIVNFNDWAALNPDALIGDLASLFEKGNKITGNNYAQYEIQIAQLIHHESGLLSFVGETAKANGLGSISSLNLKTVDFSVLGLNLAETPNLGKLWQVVTLNFSSITAHDLALWLIPLFSGFSSWLASRFTQVNNKTEKVDKNIVLPENEKKQEQPNPMQSMTVIMPLISAWFTFSFPAALGLYWIISNVYQLIQTFVMNKVVMPKIENEFKGEFINVKENRKKRKKH